MTFDDLTFKPPTACFFNEQALVFFPNGYGASVVRSEYTYGGREGLYELGVLRGNADEWGLTYETPITNDVEGYLTPEAVTDLLVRIEALPVAEEDF